MKKDLTSRTKQLQSIEFRLNRLDQNRKSIGLPLNTSQLLTELEDKITNLEAITIKKIEQIKNNAHVII